MKSGPRSIRRSRRTLGSAELRLQEFVHGCRIRLASTRLHDLAHKKTEQGGFSVPVLFHLLRIGTDHLICQGLESARVGDLAKALAIHDGCWGFSRFEHLREDLLRELTGEFAGSDELYKFAEMLSTHRTIRKILSARL